MSSIRQRSETRSSGTSCAAGRCVWQRCSMLPLVGEVFMVFCLPQLPGSTMCSLNVELTPTLILWRLRLLLWEYLHSHPRSQIIARNQLETSQPDKNSNKLMIFIMEMCMDHNLCIQSSQFGACVPPTKPLWNCYSGQVTQYPVCEASRNISDCCTSCRPVICSTCSCRALRPIQHALFEPRKDFCHH